MMQPSLGNIVQAIRKLARSESCDDQADEQLLSRFVKDRDEAAFQTLVQRHGPAVLGLCRRILGDAHLAEDALQAAFLILARRAAAIKRRQSLGSWLNRVAYHVALQARQERVRQQTRERSYSNIMEPREEKSNAAMSEVLEQELQRLPEKYRAPLLLCYLEGKTKSEAARQLGWTEGSIHGRLERARETLRTRLTRRGVALPAAGLLSALSNQLAPAAVPMALLNTTARSALLFVTGRTTSGLISIRALSLTQGMLNTMRIANMKMLTGVIALLAVLGVGIANWVIRSSAAEPTASTNQPSSKDTEPIAAENRQIRSVLETERVNHIVFVDNRRLLAGENEISLWDLYTGDEKAFGIDCPKLQRMTVSPDGQTIAAYSFWQEPNEGRKANPQTKFVLLNARSGRAIFELHNPRDVFAVFSAEGRSVRILVDELEEISKGGETVFQSIIVETASGKARSKDSFRSPPSAKVRGEYCRNEIVACDERTVVFMSRAGDLWICDAITGKKRGRVPVIDHTIAGDPTFWNRLSSDGCFWATMELGETGSIYFWDTTTGREIRRFPLWARDDGPEYKNLTELTPDSERVVASSPVSGLKLVDVKSSKVVATFKDVKKNEWACSMDGRTIAIGGKGNCVRLCRTDTGEQIRSINGLSGEIVSLAFSPDGSLLAAGCKDKKIRLWDLNAPAK